MNIVMQIFHIVLFLVQALLCALALGALSTAALYSPSDSSTPTPPLTYENSCKDFYINEATWLTFVGMALSCSMIVTNPKLIQLMSPPPTPGQQPSTWPQLLVIAWVLTGTLLPWGANIYALTKVQTDDECNKLLTSPDSGIDTKIVQNELIFAIAYGLINVAWCVKTIIWDVYNCCPTCQYGYT